MKQQKLEGWRNQSLHRLLIFYFSFLIGLHKKFHNDFSMINNNYFLLLSFFNSRKMAAFIDCWWIQESHIGSLKESANQTNKDLRPDPFNFSSKISIPSRILPLCSLQVDQAKHKVAFLNKPGTLAIQYFMIEPKYPKKKKEGNPWILVQKQLAK